MSVNPSLLAPLAVAGGLCLMTLATPVTATTQTSPASQQSAKPATTPARATAPAAAAPKAARPTQKAVPAEPERPLAEAEGEQLAAAALTHFGEYMCEFKQTLKVAINPKHDGYVDVQFGKNLFTMRPVMSSTGALRLEDVKGKVLLLQIAFKSMLMDVQAGRRLVDECVHDNQRVARERHEANPQPGLGISSGPATAATAAAR